MTATHGALMVNRSAAQWLYPLSAHRRIRWHRALFMDGYAEMLRRLEPEKVIFFGDVPAGCTGCIEHHNAFHAGLAHAQKR